MSDSEESKKQTHPLTLIGFGWLLFVVGLPCWALLSDALQVLDRFAEWPKMAGIAGVPVPLLFVAAWKHDARRTGEIGWLMLGWSIGAGMAWLAIFIGSLAPHG
ncbi:hypothetical protein [Burkholderia stabilis]|uniref:Transmembrane protein n=1 Tax=Burkholderia stabilis TaxID=95485 RepID=A0AAJ5NCC1_9BURK|nr:hypothetical protein [Burkholderia stabilis]VBB15568.1 hypothetical protein BSTAB16_5764 [Burkholderia stabilis]